MLPFICLFFTSDVLQEKKKKKEGPVEDWVAYVGRLSW